MNSKFLTFFTGLSLFSLFSCQNSDKPQCVIRAAVYKGWESLDMSNGLVNLQIVPAVGGRIIQFAMDKKEFLWVNPDLAGKLPTQSGLAADGSWLNYGGDKLWPAPQGWTNENEWPGPPDSVLDGQPYKLEKLARRKGQSALRLTSRKDLRSGIQFSRVISIFDGSTRVSFDATMTNIDNKPRRWGIWAHTQLDAAGSGGTSFNRQMNAWCPINPKSKFPKGYSVIFGEQENSSFQPDPLCGLMRVQYQYKVGKTGLDSPAGWSATVDGISGSVFVQRFVFEPDKDYPDGSSVEFWLNGTGKIHAYNKDLVQSQDPAINPYVFESELLSPLVTLEPGQSYKWKYDWYATQIGGDFPVVECSNAGVVSEPLRVTLLSGMASLEGRFGVFYTGNSSVVFSDSVGLVLKNYNMGKVSPLKCLIVDTVLPVPAGASSVSLVLIGQNDKMIDKLSVAAIPHEAVSPRWSRTRINDWYSKQPWMVGCNFLPSTAVNDIEMWMPETFDTTAIDRELSWAENLGYNNVRVFINFVVWELNPAGLKNRFSEFLKIASRHGITAMVILLDDCAKQNPVASKQDQPVPGVHNSQWVASPGKAVVMDKNQWPKLEAYVKDMVSTYGRDSRVGIWDLYNEPEKESTPLAEACFRWAREVNPDQPLTIGAWWDFNSPFSRRLMELSDLISFHGYDPTAGVEEKMRICALYGRPVICTEWMVRREGNDIPTLLPLFHDRRIGSWHWGFVAGRTQTYFPWGSPRNAPEPKIWQHDIFRKNGTPFNPDEIRRIKDITGKKSNTG
jgi:hypothetical protein